MNKFTYIFLFLAGFLFFTDSVAQRGKVIKPATTSVLDPNGDGYVSISTSGFSNDGYNVDEFEIPMFGLPKSDAGEVLNDIQAGANCGTTELTYDNKGFSVYGVHKNGNLIFRFRVANDKPSVEAYSILVDTDGRVGSDDPNSTPENPGFEIDITLIKNNSKGVYVYNIDGIESCPNALLHYPLSSNFQISVADEVSCSDPDYFYDYYVPFADIAAQFNISLNTELRFVSLTNVSATCAMGGKISDIGGVDDTPYNGCNACAFIDLAVNQCPTSLNNLCPTCAGFLTGVTPKPTIDAPLKAGEFDITGTALPNAFVYLSIFNSAKALKEKDTVNANGSGAWLKTLAAPLAVGDSITAQAKAVGQCNSGGTSSGTSFTVVVQNIPPVLAGTNPGLIQYNENDPPKILTPAITVTDPDDTEIDGATITITSNFNSGQDVLAFTPSGGVTGSFDTSTGVLTLTGSATLAAYQAVLRSVTFANTSENPNNSVRGIAVKIFDGLDYSNVFSFSVQVNPVNDPPVISSSTIVVEYAGTALVINSNIAITDVDNTQLTGAIVSFTNNFNNAQDGLVFVDQNGITGSYNATTGVLTLTGTSTLANYATALSSIKYSNSSGAPTQLTRRVSYVVNDGTSSSNTLQSFVTFNGAVNHPPIIVDGNGNSIDNLNYTINEDTELNTCINVVDPDGDPVALSAFTNQVGAGTFSIASALCFKFVPQTNQNGQVTATITVCDQTSGSLCDAATVTITITPVNDPPVITLTTATVLENSSNNICITYTDIENDAAVFTVGSSANNSSTISNGIVTDACFTYAPNTGFTGNDPVTVTICDANDPTVCTTSVVNIQVNALPNHPPETLINGLPGSTLHIQVDEDSTAVLCFEAFDQDGDDISLSSINKITNSGGSLSLYQNIEFCFLYTPVANHNGTVEFDVTVCDNHNPSLCAVVRVIVDVIPVNDPPVITLTTATVQENSTNNICITYTDIENDAAVFTAGSSGNNSSTISNGIVTDACFTYAPNTGFSGNDPVTVTICDANDPTVCTTSVVNVHVNPLPNHPPGVLINGLPGNTLHIQVKEDSTAVLCFETFDQEGDQVSLSSINKITNGGGSLSLDHQDVEFCFRYTPLPNHNGTVEFDVTVCDNHSPSLCAVVRVIVDVIPVNDPPVIVTTTVQTRQDSVASFCLQVTDVENDPAVFTSGSSQLSLGTVTDPNSTDQCFTYTPKPGFIGTDNVSVTVCDATDGTVCSTSVLTVSVLPKANVRPIIAINGTPIDTLRLTIKEDSVLNFCLDVTDPNTGDKVSVSSITNTQGGGTFTNPNGFCFVFTPILNYNGTSKWNITVCDDHVPSLCTTLNVIITITPVNDPPVIVPQVFHVVQDTAKTICLTVTDVENDGAVFTSGSSNNSLGSITDGTPGDLCFLYTPTPGKYGDDTISVTVCDVNNSTVCSTTSLTVEVLPGINLPPKIFINNLPKDTLRATIPEDSLFAFCFTAVDPNKDPVSFASAINIRGGGQMTKGNNFCFTFKPTLNFNGIASWVITVCDNKTPALCGSLVVIINVTPVNDPPIAVSDTLTSLRFVQGLVNVLKNDADVEFNKLSVNPLAAQAPLHGQYLLSADGDLFYTSERYFRGTDILKYSVCDDGVPSKCSEGTVLIDVGDLPLKPYEAFSPNGDGQNDYWRIEGVDFYPDNVVRVFDRYNNLVFQLDGYNNENKMWRGESNHGIVGGKLPEGTYYYAITLEGGKSPLKGFVVLKRE